METIEQAIFEAQIHLEVSALTNRIDWMIDEGLADTVIEASIKLANYHVTYNSLVAAGCSDNDICMYTNELTV